jgi:hypothetical protein
MKEALKQEAKGVIAILGLVLVAAVVLLPVIAISYIHISTVDFLLIVAVCLLLEYARHGWGSLK